MEIDVLHWGSLLAWAQGGTLVGARLCGGGVGVQVGCGQEDHFTLSSQI